MSRTCEPVYILGWGQTDFAKNWSRDNLGIDAIMYESVVAAMDQANIEPNDIEVAHVGNFTAELFSRQGHLGGIFAALHPSFHGLPTSRHEAACASGSMAILAAMADLLAGFYDVACVTGVEQMRNVSGHQAAEHLGAAAWHGREAQDAKFLWPWMFSELWNVYQARYGAKREHLAEIARMNFQNAKDNPNAQTRNWTFLDESFSEHPEANPIIEGHIRRQDCSQITDGSASLILATPEYAAAYARKRNLPMDSLPKILGFGHRTGTMLFEDKLSLSKDSELVFPHLAQTIQDAFKRAGVANALSLSGVETHDCFSVTQYMAIDHFGITSPGESFKAIEAGWTERRGKIPFNAGGGLMGGGHPVGATGVRMVVDAAKQVTGSAGDYQIEAAHTMATLNIGGSATTCASFIVGH